MPSFDVTIGHYTLAPNPFWGGIVFPLFVLALRLSFPWVERRLSGDRSAHNLADRPRDAPTRTAFGIAFLSWVFLIFVFGAADRLFVLFGLSYDLQLYVFRIGIWVVPLVLFLLVRRVCQDLHAADQVEAIQHAAELEAERELAAASGAGGG